jgi:hypothetical protein
MSARINSRTAKPAASSFAVLIRKPDDSLSTDVPKASYETPSCRAAFAAMMLFLMANIALTP